MITHLLYSYVLRTPAPLKSSPAIPLATVDVSKKGSYWRLDRVHHLTRHNTGYMQSINR